jgi:hypothetical protein
MSCLSLEYCRHKNGVSGSIRDEARYLYFLNAKQKNSHPLTGTRVCSRYHPDYERFQKTLTTSTALTSLTRQVLPALRISLLLLFIWDFFQPWKSLSYRWAVTYSILLRFHMYYLWRYYDKFRILCQCSLNLTRK